MLELVLILLGIVAGMTALLFWAINRPVVCPREPAGVARSAYERPGPGWPGPTSGAAASSMLDAQFAPGQPSLVYSQMTAA